MDNYYKQYKEKLSTIVSEKEAQTLILWLLEKLTGKPAAVLFTAKTTQLTKAQEKQLEEWIKLLVEKKYPIQYILGSVPFGELTILVEPPLLIPRPETEEWVHIVLEKYKQYKDEPFTLLDMCCGSGCIGITLAHFFTNSQIYCVDISEKALALTQKNIAHNALKNIHSIQSDLFSELPQTIRFDLILCNPPYVTESEWNTLEPNVKQWEDKNALVAKNNGLAFYERLLHEAPQWIKKDSYLKNNPQIILEIGSKQGHTVSQLVENAGFKATTKQDYAKQDRTIWITV